MKLIIDIDEDDYKEVKEYGINTFPSLAITIKNGIPLDDLRTKIEEAKTVRLTKDDTMIESSIDAVINPQYKNFTSGLDMAIYIIDKYRGDANEMS